MYLLICSVLEYMDSNLSCFTHISVKNTPTKLSSNLFAVIFIFEFRVYGHSSYVGNCDQMVLRKMNYEKWKMKCLS